MRALFRSPFPVDLVQACPCGGGPTTRKVVPPPFGLRPILPAATRPAPQFGLFFSRFDTLPGVLAQKREKRGSEEDTQQRRENADRKRKKHEDRQPTGLRFRQAAIAQPKRIGLSDEKICERRAESCCGAHQCRDPSLGGTYAAESGERFVGTAPQREICEKPPRLRESRHHRRTHHERR